MIGRCCSAEVLASQVVPRRRRWAMTERRGGWLGRDGVRSRWSWYRRVPGLRSLWEEREEGVVHCREERWVALFAVRRRSSLGDGAVGLGMFWNEKADVWGLLVTFVSFRAEKGCWRYLQVAYLEASGRGAHARSGLRGEEWLHQGHR